MPDLITLHQLKRELRMEETSADDDVLIDKLKEAQEIILAYIARPDDEDWTAEIAGWTLQTVPRAVRAAIKMQAVELNRFRGDDVDLPKRESGRLAPAIEAYLYARGFRRHVLA